MTEPYLLWILAASALSLILYWRRIWAGGDSKLYIVIAFSLPYSIVIFRVFNISLLISVLLLSFILGYIYLLVESTVKLFCDHTEIKSLLISIKNSLFRYVRYYLAIIFINSVYTWVISRITIVPDISILRFIINIIAIHLMNHFKILDELFVMIGFICADIMLGILDLSALTNRYNIISWFLIIISFFLRALSEKYNYEEIAIDNLEKGMILSIGSSIVLAGNHAIDFKTVSDESLRSRLTDEDISSIKKIKGIKNCPDSVVIVRKVPFAIFLAVSTIIILGGYYFGFFDMLI